MLRWWLGSFQKQKGSTSGEIKDFQNYFRKNDLDIVIKGSLKIVDYFDVSHWTFSLTPTNLSLNLTTKSTISIGNPTTHRL